MLWARPAAIEGLDLEGFCAPGQLADRIMKAGQDFPGAPRGEGV
jgi:hypothetical protein